MQLLTTKNNKTMSTTEKSKETNPSVNSKDADISFVSEWVAIDEALPIHGEEVLTVTEDNWYRITQFGSIGKGKFPSQVTHWMRLPEPPCR